MSLAFLRFSAELSSFLCSCLKDWSSDIPNERILNSKIIWLRIPTDEIKNSVVFYLTIPTGPLWNSQWFGSLFRPIQYKKMQWFGLLFRPTQYEAAQCCDSLFRPSQYEIEQRCGSLIQILVLVFASFKLWVVNKYFPSYPNLGDDLWKCQSMNILFDCYSFIWKTVSKSFNL